jgi:hypothetical protein
LREKKEELIKKMSGLENEFKAKAEEKVKRFVYLG